PGSWREVLVVLNQQGRMAGCYAGRLAIRRCAACVAENRAIIERQGEADEFAGHGILTCRARTVRVRVVGWGRVVRAELHSGQRHSRSTLSSTVGRLIEDASPDLIAWRVRALRIDRLRPRVRIVVRGGDVERDVRASRRDEARSHEEGAAGVGELAVVGRVVAAVVEDEL